MSYLVLDGFPKGLDVRRFSLAPQPGSLVELSNGHLTNGGEIEKRKAFPLYANVAIAETGAQLTSGVRTFGMQETGVGLTVFGSALVFGAGVTLSQPVFASAMPTGVTYQQLKHPAVIDGVTYDKTKHAMTAVTGSCVYGGLIFAVATFSDGNVFCYYDGALVRDMTDGLIMAHLDTNTKIATAIKEMVNRSSRYKATSSTNIVTITGPVGETFQSGTNNVTSAGVLTPLLTSLPTPDVVANAATGSFKVMAGSSSAGVNKITKVEVNGVTITNAAVDWTTSNEVTAGLLAASINTKVSSPEYTAQANGNLVTIFAAESQGDTPNGFEVKITATGNVCCGDAAFQFAGSAFSVTNISVDGTNVLTTTPIAMTGTINATVLAIAVDINAGTSAGATHGYLACAIGPILFLSKAVTSSADAAKDVYFVMTVTAGSGGGVTQINGGLASILALSAVAAGGGLQASGNSIYHQWLGTVSVAASDGVGPYTYEWVLTNSNANITPAIVFFENGGATSSNPKIFANSYALVGTIVGTAYCNVTDAVGSVKKSQLVQLVLSSQSYKL